VAAIISVN